MNRFGDRFDHNLHALRIVETFEQRYARFPGLNLTFEVREGIAKHSRDFEPGEDPQLDEYLPGLRPPLEAQLIDLPTKSPTTPPTWTTPFPPGSSVSTTSSAAVPAYAAIYADMEMQFPGRA